MRTQRMQDDVLNQNVALSLLLALGDAELEAEARVTLREIGTPDEDVDTFLGQVRRYRIRQNVLHARGSAN